jgi:cell division protein FtsB
MKISFVKMTYVAAVLCGVIYAFIVLQGPNGIPGLLAKRREVKDLEQVTQRMHRELEEKQQHIQRLEQNPAAQEFEIRQRLKLARPGEKIYIIDEKK